MYFYFFFQAEDGIRDKLVTGVQTLLSDLKDANTLSEAELAAIPSVTPAIAKAIVAKRPFVSITELNSLLLSQGLTAEQARSEERRVGKEWRSGWSPRH